MCDICVQTDSERMNQIEVSRREVCAQTDS